MGITARSTSEQLTRVRARHGEWMVEHGRHPTGERVRIASDAELAQQGSEIEVRPLADHTLAVEDKNDDQREIDGATRGRQPAPRTGMRSLESPFDQPGVVRV